MNRDTDPDAPEAKYAICPITLAETDASNIASAITVIRDTRNATVDERTVLAHMGFVVPPEKHITIHIADTYDIDAAYAWFSLHGSHPISRRHLSPTEISRIEFRYNHRGFLAMKPSRETLVTLFRNYLVALDGGCVDTQSDDFTMLRCHLAPEDLPNFLYMTREDAQNRLIQARIAGENLGWIIRPSKFKGYEFAKDSDGNMYPMTEYVAITVCVPGSDDDTAGDFQHSLFEKVFSRGYFNGSGSYDSADVLNFSRDQKGVPCFFDLLHQYLLCMVSKKHSTASACILQESDDVWKIPRSNSTLTSAAPSTTNTPSTSQPSSAEQSDDEDEKLGSRSSRNAENRHLAIPSLGTIHEHDEIVKALSDSLKARLQKLSLEEDDDDDTETETETVSNYESDSDIDEDVGDEQ